MLQPKSEGSDLAYLALASSSSAVLWSHQWKKLMMTHDSWHKNASRNAAQSTPNTPLFQLEKDHSATRQSAGYRTLKAAAASHCPIAWLPHQVPSYVPAMTGRHGDSSKWAPHGQDNSELFACPTVSATWKMGKYIHPILHLYQMSESFHLSISFIHPKWVLASWQNCSPA